MYQCTRLSCMIRASPHGRESSITPVYMHVYIVFVASYMYMYIAICDVLLTCTVFTQLNATLK